MSKEKFIKILGFAGTIIAISMFISLLEVAQSNISGQSHIWIQPLVTTINCSVWSVYSLLQKEKYVFAANIPGVFLGLFTLVSAFI
jgi:tellurite resistance protein TehA-like permease